MRGTIGLLSSCTGLAIEPKVSNPPKAIPFLRFSTASGTVYAPSKYRYIPLGIYNTQSVISVVHLTNQVHVLTI